MQRTAIWKYVYYPKQVLIIKVLKTCSPTLFFCIRRYICIPLFITDMMSRNIWVLCLALICINVYCAENEDLLRNQLQEIVQKLTERKIQHDNEVETSKMDNGDVPDLTEHANDESFSNEEMLEEITDGGDFQNEDFRSSNEEDEFDEVNESDDENEFDEEDDFDEIDDNEETYRYLGENLKEYDERELDDIIDKSWDAADLMLQERINNRLTIARKSKIQKSDSISLFKKVVP